MQRLLTRRSLQSMKIAKQHKNEPTNEAIKDKNCVVDNENSRLMVFVVSSRDFARCLQSCDAEKCKIHDFNFMNRNEEFFQSHTIFHDFPASALIEFSRVGFEDDDGKLKLLPLT
jgi:hypothetical protein